MADWYSRAREEDGRTDDEVVADLTLRCPGCKHPDPDPHDEDNGGAWCLADMVAAMASGYDPRSVGPCY